MDINFDYKVTNGDAVKEIHAVYNVDTKQYEAQYVIENAGDHAVSMDYVADNLVLYTGLYTVPKADVTLVVSVENTTVGNAARVKVSATDKDEAGIAGLDIVVLVNDVEYNVVTGDDGTYTFDVAGLPAGQYAATAIFFGNDNYNRAYDTDAFAVKAESGLTVSIENIDYGEEAIIVVTLYDADNNPLSGVVEVTFAETSTTYLVAVADGIGTLSVVGLDAGTYTYTAVSRETADETAAGPTDAQTFTVSPGELTVDFKPTQTVTGQPIAGTILITDENGDDVKVTGVVVKIVKDGETEPIAEIPIAEIDGTYNFVYDGELAPGEYTLVVSVPDQDNYPAVTDEINFTIPLKDTASVVVGTDGENITIEAKDGTTPLNGTATVVIDGGEPITVPIDETGKAVVPMDDLAPGQHTVEVTFAKDGYEPVSEVATITVPKATPTVTIAPSKESYAYGEDVVLDVTVLDGTTGVTGTVVVTINNVNYAVDVTDGVGQLTVKGLANGTYTATAKFLATDDYVEAEADNAANVVVNATTDATITATVSEPTADGKATVTVNVVDGAGKPVTGKVNVTVNGASTEYDVTDGVATIPIEGLNTGDNTIVVSTDDYTAEPVTITATVPPKDTASVVVGTDGENITIEAKDGTTPLNGTATVVIDGGEPITVPIDETGKAVVPMDDLAPGQHTVEVTFAKDGYEPVSEVATITVPKATPTVTIAPSKESYAYGEDVVLDVTVLDGTTGVTGTVVVTINNVNYAVDVTDGVGQLTVKGLANGTYTATAKFLATDDYDAASAAPANVVVNAPIPKPIPVVTIVASKESYDFGEGVVLDVTVKDGETGVTGTVVVTVDGVKYLVDVSGGSGQLTVKGLINGDYEASADFIANDEYDAASAAKPAKFTVDAPIPVIQVDIVVTAEPDQVIIKLIDENGNPVEGKAVVAIDGVSQEVNVTGGIATIPASAGYHNINVVYEGDDTHAGTAVMKDIVVVLPQRIGTIMTISRSKTITYNSTLDNRSDYLIYATLTDEYGNPLANKQVSLAAHGGIYNMTTNSKGQVRFYVAHSVKGVCTQALSFLGDEKYDASFVATNVQIEAQTVKFAVAKKTYKASAKTKKLTATLKNSKGKALAGKKVVFTVNGKKYTATTNSKGVATVKVSITKKGTYKVTATFAGDKTYKKATRTNKLVIK